MKKTILILLCIATTVVTAFAQQPRKVTRKWFQNPDINISTPAFSRSYGFTTYKQMMKYLRQEKEAHPQMITIETVGKTQKGKNIPLVTISNGKRDDNKLRIMYTGCVHGNEHAGTEGLLWFIHQLTADEKLKGLLDSIDLYIMPMVNIDGSEADERVTNNGTDLNRDQTRLSTPEAQCMQRLATSVMPQVYIDFHEYKPLRSSYENITNRLVTNPHDYMYLYSSNPNVYPGLREMIEQHLIPDAEAMAKKWNLNTSIYYTTKGSSNGETTMNIGGQAARSTSNIMALRGSIAMLMEIRGVGLWRTSYLRRVNTVYQLCCSYAETAKDNTQEVRKVTDEAIHSKADITTRYSMPLEKDHPFEFIDMQNNKKEVIPVDARPAKDLVSVEKVKRPKAYYIDASAKEAIDLIKKFGIKSETFSKPETLRLQTYEVLTSQAQRAEVIGVHPVNVTVKPVEETVTLPTGSIRIPSDQPLFTLASILLEPECDNGFVFFHVIEAKVGDTLPVYRSVKTY